MERISIDGGEHWVGFARSRIQALLLAGLGYARQSYNMPDGAEVMVGISDDAHTINIKLAAGSIISGVVEEGKLIELPVPAGSPPGTKPTKKLSKFRATENTVRKVMQGGSAKSFKDTRWLTEPLTTKKEFLDPLGYGSQVGAISPGLYSGEMRKVIQILLGLKKQVEITYTYDFYDTYGIHKASDDSFWLIRIAKEHGVLAMPLGLSKADESKNAPKAEEECAKIFIGVPTGADFPKDLEKAIKDKKVLRLSTKDEIKKFYELSPWFYECGWSFNKDGSEVHNTGWVFDPAIEEDEYLPIPDMHTIHSRSYAYSHHYSLKIRITPKTEGSDASGSATLEQVTKDLLRCRESYNMNWANTITDRLIPIRFMSYKESTDLSNRSVSNRMTKPHGFDRPITDIPPVTVFVGHREDGSLFKIGYSITLLPWAKRTGGDSHVYQITVDGVAWPKEHYTDYPPYKEPGGSFNHFIPDDAPLEMTYQTGYTPHPDGHFIYFGKWDYYPRPAADKLHAEQQKRGYGYHQWAAQPVHSCHNILGVRDGYFMQLCAQRYVREDVSVYKINTRIENGAPVGYDRWRTDITGWFGAKWYYESHPPKIFEGFSEAAKPYTGAPPANKNFDIRRVSFITGGFSYFGEPLFWTAFTIEGDTSEPIKDHPLGYWRSFIAGIHVLSGSKGLERYNPPSGVRSDFYHTTAPSYSFIGYTEILTADGGEK